MRPGLSGMGTRATLPPVRGICSKETPYQPTSPKPLRTILASVVATHTTAIRDRAAAKMPAPVIALPLMVACALLSEPSTEHSDRCCYPTLPRAESETPPLTTYDGTTHYPMHYL
jgi:hypothetical protein